MALRTARALVLLAAGAVVAGTILGFARGSWIAALAESFRWRYILAGVLVLALSGIARARLAAALAAVAVVTNAVVLAPLVADRPAAAAGPVPAGLGWFGLPIDGLLHSPDLTVVERRVGPSFGSEHRSLWVTLAVAAGEAA